LRAHTSLRLLHHLSHVSIFQSINLKSDQVHHIPVPCFSAPRDSGPALRWLMISLDSAGSCPEWITLYVYTMGGPRTSANLCALLPHASTAEFRLLIYAGRNKTSVPPCSYICQPYTTSVFVGPTIEATVFGYIAKTATVYHAQSRLCGQPARKSAFGRIILLLGDKTNKTQSR